MITCSSDPSLICVNVDAAMAAIGYALLARPHASPRSERRSVFHHNYLIVNIFLLMQSSRTSFEPPHAYANEFFVTRSRCSGAAASRPIIFLMQELL